MIAMENTPFIDVYSGFTYEHSDFPLCYVKLPEGKSHQTPLNRHFPVVCFPMVFRYVMLNYENRTLQPSWPARLQALRLLCTARKQHHQWDEHFGACARWVTWRS